MARKSSKNSNPIADFIDRSAAWFRSSGGTVSLVAAAVCVLVAVVLIGVGVPRLRGYLEERSFVPASAITLRFEEAPAWFDATRIEEMRRRIANAVGDGSALDATRLPTAKDALQESGWFKSIAQMRLEGNGGFLVEAEFRTPVALVLHGGREHLVDIDGCRLPLDWTLGSRPAAPHWISLLNAENPPPGQPGERWMGADVLAGLDLLAAIRGQPWESKVAAIDLARHGNDGLVLVTTTGGFVLWGYAPSVRTSSEPNPISKLANLSQLFASTGYIDHGSGRILDLRTDIATVRLAGDAPAAEDAGGVR